MKYALFLLVTFILLGCANQNEAMLNTHIVNVAPDVTLTLPHSPELLHPIEASQLVVGTYEGKKFAFEVRISGDANHFDMAALDMSGQRSISMNWTDKGIVYESAPWIPNQLAPEYILADLILIYWPLDKVRYALNGSSTLTPTHNHRSIAKDGLEIISIDYEPLHDKDIWQGNAHYQNLARGYSLDIQSSHIKP